MLLIWKVFRIGTVCYNWPMSAHASQAFSIAHCTDSEDLPLILLMHGFTLRASARDATVMYTLRSVRMRTVRSNRLTLRTVRVHGT